MTHDECFRNALQRPVDYHRLSHDEQWNVDRQLGILDWPGPMTDEEWNRLRQHHGLRQPTEPIPHLALT